MMNAARQTQRLARSDREVFAARNARRVFVGMLGVGVALLAGCATDRGQGEREMRALVERNTGFAFEQGRGDDGGSESVNLGKLTPERCVELALLGNRNLQVVLGEIGLSRADWIAAGRLRNPDFGASVRWPDGAPFGSTREFSLAGDVMDALFLPMRRRLAAEALLQAQERVAHEVLGLIAEVRSAAYEHQAALQVLDRMGVGVEIAEAAADLAGRQHAAGNIQRLELAQRQVGWQVARLERLKAEVRVRTSREKLNRLMGFWGDRSATWTIAPELAPVPDVEVNLEGLEERAVESRLDLAVARRQEVLARTARTWRGRTRYLPTSLMLGADWERESDGLNLVGPTLGLNVPIFEQGQADMARLSTLERQAAARVAGLAIDIRSEVRERRDVFRATREMALYHQKILLPQRQAVLRETLLQYNAMQVANYDLLEAKDREQEAMRAAIESVREYWTARAELERAVGFRLGAALSPDGRGSDGSGAKLGSSEVRTDAPPSKGAQHKGHTHHE